MPVHEKFVKDAIEAKRYYRNENDILTKGARREKEQSEDTPIRSADNRISHNFHGLLVNQKTAYMFTASPLFDIGNPEANKRIANVLGDKYAKVCKDLCINASNASVSWLHYWKDEKGTFKYGVIESEQIIPVWSSDLERELQSVLRVYRRTQDDGKTYTVYEIWTEKECQSFIRQENLSVDIGLSYYSILDFSVVDTSEGSIYDHGMERVPFIPFFNNNVNTNDLKNIKGLIDAYDKVYSGYVNDLEDIQEIIFILSGYGGTDLKEFMQDLKLYKAVKLDADSDKPGLSTLAIDIPVEAREKLLAMTRKEIFEQGQGVDPQPESFGNKSGEALKFMYALLELKAGLMETEFKLGFGELVRAICQYLNVPCETLTQTWTRTSIKNDTEISDICRNSVGIISNKTVLKNHPLVENAEEEEKQIAKEKKEAEESEQEYKRAFADKSGDVDEE
ncbi:portal protein [Acetivibrio ethanolgignens]|uniref:Portal protein n=2 Tax=Acetivibrio ethanolgignens TaxID=290052 RepID=A0A0V8QIF6_9FIRM|nr:portal protein [Acetivibrio ethanolgignens]